ncbi:acyl--CoA ligase [Candidatus Binatia bacterium]|nr:acyl--CoA ligase [Candidatus Binatia bacterium]
MKLLGDWLREIARDDGARDAFVYRDPRDPDGVQRRLTYADWDRRSDAIAAGLVELGFAKGDVLAILLPPRVEYALCYLAAAKIGVITTGINPRFGDGEIEHVLRDSGARAVVTLERLGERELASLVRRLGARIATLEHVVVAGGTREAPGKACNRDPEVRAPSLTTLAAVEGVDEEGGPSRHPNPPKVDLSPDDLVALVYTSGTTGKPKGAAFSYANLDAIRPTRAEMLQEYGERSLATGTPFSHVGFMTKIVANVAGAQTTVLLETFKARTVLETIARERITYVGGVPAQFSLILMDPELERFDLSSLRTGAIGGAPFTPELVRSIRERLGIELVTRYACTETAVGTGSRRGDGEERLANTVGRASDIAELRVVDDARRPLPPGEVGEVAIRSPAVMRGYWKQPEATAQVLDADGFYYTGDLGVLDQDGYLKLVGRKKEMYIRGGYNVYPVEVEAVLGEHPQIAQVAVIGIPDPVLGERGVAFLVPRDPARPPDADDVRAFVKRHIADYKAPDRVVVCAELPLTPGMKVDKAALLARMTADTHA